MSQEKIKKSSTDKKKHRGKCATFVRQFLGRILLGLFHIFHIIKDKLLNYILEIYWGPKNTNVCPPISENNEFLLKSATDLARMIRNKEMTSYDITKGYIDRINQINPIINAIVDGPFEEEALNEAKSIDQRIRNNEYSTDELRAKPFLGVPFTTKDSTAVANKLYTLGLVARKASKTKENAKCVELMKSAGAIIIATSNIPEVNKWQETRNNLIGQTNNPYDVRRTVGGSSGGEASLVSACGTPIGLGTDIGGSIRMPAFYCGVYGHKPTGGIVNTRGCTFRTGTETSTMVSVGPITRYARDLAPLLSVLVEPESRYILRLNDTVDVKKLKYYYIRQSGEWRTSCISNDLQNAMTRVVEHFESICDTPPKEIKLYGTDFTYKMWRYWMTQEPSDFNKLLGNNQKLNPFIEMGKKLIGRCDYTLASIYSLFDEFFPKENASKMKEISRKCYEDLQAILDDDGILFYHNTTQTAPFHYAPLINIYNFSFWCLFNVLQVPTTQVPLGLDENGLPLGIQVIATKYRDRDCLAVAMELEKVFSGWKQPFE